MNLLITSNSFGSADKSVFEKLENAGFTITTNKYKRIMTEEELAEELKGKDAVILGTEVLSEKVLEQCPDLKVVSRYGVGCDNIDMEALKKRNIPLEITRGANSNAVADHAVALMLNVAHHINTADAHIKEGIWKKETSLDLNESKVGIIGLGAIGKGVAKRVSGFGCEIYGFDVYYDEAFMEEYHIRKADVSTILKECDFITLHVPATPEFHQFMNEEAFRSCKNTAIVINTARADLVDHDALYKALENGWIAGYGADVMKDEPEVDTKLASCPNTVLTPHMGAVTTGAIKKVSEMAAENVLKYFK